MTTALAFSGGKDSWACLWLNEHRLADLTVLWVNTGKNYPEMLATIARAKAMCPNFVEVLVDRDGQNAHHGIPSDVVPINWTRQGQIVTGDKLVRIQSYLQCCYENIGASLQRYCKEQGVTTLIRGQRNDEGHKSTARDGCMVEGVRYEQPIEGWNAQQVIEYVGGKMALPNHFRFEHSSMDCYDCTAYADQSQDRIAHAQEHHPALHAEYLHRHAQLKQALTQSMRNL